MYHYAFLMLATTSMANEGILVNGNSTYFTLDASGYQEAAIMMGISANENALAAATSIYGGMYHDFNGRIPLASVAATSAFSAAHVNATQHSSHPLNNMGKENLLNLAALWFVLFLQM